MTFPPRLRATVRDDPLELAIQGIEQRDGRRVGRLGIGKRLVVRDEIGSGRPRARSSIRGDATPSASPGGNASAFCEPVKTKSRFHAAVSTGDPASEVTASTRNNTSSNSETTLAMSAIGASAPVDVSECTALTASRSVRRIASRK
jgi:hypothetical protein